MVHVRVGFGEPSAAHDSVSRRVPLVRNATWPTLKLRSFWKAVAPVVWFCRLRTMVGLCGTLVPTFSDQLGSLPGRKCQKAYLISKREFSTFKRKVLS